MKFICGLFALSLSLAACGGGSDDEDTGTLAESDDDNDNDDDDDPGSTDGGDEGGLTGANGLYEVDLEFRWGDETVEQIAFGSDAQWTEDGHFFNIGTGPESLLFETPPFGERLARVVINIEDELPDDGVLDVPSDALLLGVSSFEPDDVFFPETGEIDVLACPTAVYDPETGDPPPADAFTHIAVDFEAVSPETADRVWVKGEIRGPNVATWEGVLYAACP